VARFAGLLLGLWLAGCGGVDALRQPDAVGLNAFPSGIPLVIQRGHTGSVAVQAVDAAGDGVDGMMVTFLRADPRALSFPNSDSGADSTTSTTATASVFGVKAPGLVSTLVSVSPSAPLGPTLLFAGFAGAGFDGGAGVVRIAIEVDPSDSDAEADAPAGDDAADLDASTITGVDEKAPGKDAGVAADAGGDS
jgi:hypothetical protein